MLMPDDAELDADHDEELDTDEEFGAELIDVDDAGLDDDSDKRGTARAGGC